MEATDQLKNVLVRGASITGVC